MGRSDPGRDRDGNGTELIYIQTLIVRRADNGGKARTQPLRRAPVIPFESLRRDQVRPFQSQYRTPTPPSGSLRRLSRSLLQSMYRVPALPVAGTLRNPAAQSISGSLDFWINALALLGLAGFGLSLYYYW